MLQIQRMVGGLYETQKYHSSFLTATLLFSSVPVSYPSSIFAAETVSEVQVAEPLESDTVRFTVVDYDTGEIIDLKKEFGYFAIVPYVWRSDAEQQKPSTNYVYPDSNPYIWKQSISEEEKMSVWLADGSLNDNYFLPEDHEEITRYENGAVDAVIKLKSNESFELPPNTVRVTVTDGDTGELVPDEAFADDSFSFGTCIVTKGGVTGPIIIVRKNRDVIKENLASLYKSADKFELYFDGESEIKVYDNNSMDIFLTTAPKAEANGDVNDDGEFNVADVVLLQKWLLAVPDMHLANWKAVDFCNDNVLNVFDLCLMKQELTKKMVTTYVEPDERFEFGVPFYVLEDGVKLYSGPDESYDVIASIPADTRLTESGVKKNNNTWLFTEYNGQCGWINTLDPDGNMVIRFDQATKKPVIYLYPEQETDVHVELELTESELNTTYPKYNNGWNVTAYPNGRLLNKADGTHHRSLFWDAVNCRTRYDFSKGFCVAGSNTESFLKEKLTYMGLTEDEMNEFIVYWLPLMEHNEYNLISFQGDVYTNSAKLNITPAPDSILRIFMAYVPLEDEVNIEPQQLNTFERKGFTVVEWGGSNIQ